MMVESHLSPVQAQTVIFKLFGSVGLVKDGDCSPSRAAGSGRCWPRC